MQQLRCVYVGLAATLDRLPHAVLQAQARSVYHSNGKKRTQAADRQRIALAATDDLRNAQSNHVRPMTMTERKLGASAVESHNRYSSRSYWVRGRHQMVTSHSTTVTIPNSVFRLGRGGGESTRFLL